MSADVKFLPGDHLWKSGGKFGGVLYDHHLIYEAALGDGKHSIIENSFRAGRVLKKTITDDRLRTFSLYERPTESVACLAKAKAAIGAKYHLLWHNCEHFANDCARGRSGSRQIRRASGHVALAVATASGAAVAVSVGLVTNHVVIVPVVAKGWKGLFWQTLGYQKVKTVIYQTWNRLGLEASGGAGTASCLWCCFTMFRRDPNKKRQPRQRAKDVVVACPKSVERQTLEEPVLEPELRTDGASAASAAAVLPLPSSAAAAAAEEDDEVMDASHAEKLIRRLLEAEQKAAELVAAARLDRLAKLRRVKEIAEADLKCFREDREAKFQDEIARRSDIIDPSSELKGSASTEIFMKVQEDYEQNKVRTIEYIVNRVLDVPIGLSMTQIQSLKAGTV
jgi:hypothetical protein